MVALFPVCHAPLLAETASGQNQENHKNLKKNSETGELDRNDIETKNNDFGWAHRMVIILPLGGVTFRRFPLPVCFHIIEKR
jgi:hypothetical protein